MTYRQDSFIIILSQACTYSLHVNLVPEPASTDKYIGVLYNGIAAKPARFIVTRK